MQINIPTPSVKLPSLPKFNVSTPSFATKRRVLITLGVLAFLAIVLVSLALAGRQADAEAARQAQAALQAKQEDEAINKRLTALEAANASLLVEANKKVAACSYIVQLSANFNTRRFVTVPPACR